MRKTVLVFTLAAVLALLLTGMALANHQGDPVGGCPDKFELHHIGDDHHGEHEHHHAGSDQDKNGDGYLCVKHVAADESVHVHRDNNANLPLD